MGSDYHRPRAVWKAHENAILGVAEWGEDKLITHGRDNRLIVWKFGIQEESTLSTVLPLDTSQEDRPQPWMVHMMEVNTMNFCTFSSCRPPTSSAAYNTDLLIAVPNTLQSEAIDIFHLPSQRRQQTVKLGDKNGMVMALSLFYRHDTLILIAGYENGLAIVAQLLTDGSWEITYRATTHTQPVLSLDVVRSQEFFYTSSADAVIAKHPIPLLNKKLPPTTTASSPTSSGKPAPSSSSGVSLLSAALASQPQSQAQQIGSNTATEVETQPLKVINTKHSGQQDLKIRSDSKIFATAGWDGRIRVYSVKTMKEVAVLKWHQVGCYAVAFSTIEDGEEKAGSKPVSEEEETARSGAGTVVPRLVEMTVREKRIRHVKTAHWLAAGSKDGKVSLWDVY